MSGREIDDADTIVSRSTRAERDRRIVRSASLVVLEGAGTGTKVPLEQALIIGRSSACGLRLDDASVSRRHARIERNTGGDFVITDLESRNGIFINGEAVVDAHPLTPGDRIRVGTHVTVLFSLEDPMEGQLRQAQKMEALGRLSAGITHDLNNLLSVLSANLDFIQSKPVDTALSDADLQECLSELATATQRAAELTSRLGAFVRHEKDQHHSTNISDLCLEVARLMQRVLPAQIQLDSEIAPMLFVRGSRPLLHQMLMNPCINARDAMPNGGVLTIRAHLAGGEDPARPDPTVVVTVSDTGVGMDPETLRAAFEPFFTTKPEGGGTGLGLATVQKICHEHGGSAKVASTIGKGTTVTIALPATERGPRTSHHTARFLPVNTPVAGASVLIVDDEPDVARSAGRLLQQRGYRVTYAAHGREALERYDHGPAPDLVLLDLDMPVMGGRECLQRLRRLDSEANVVVVSGLWSEAMAAEMRDAGAANVLRKPLSDAALQVGVATALREAGHP